MACAAPVKTLIQLPKVALRVGRCDQIIMGIQIVRLHFDNAPVQGFGISKLSKVVEPDVNPQCFISLNLDCHSLCFIRMGFGLCDY